MSTVEFISGKVTDTAASNFLETNSTAIVCQNFHIILNKANEISCLWDVLRKMSMMGFISGTVTDTAPRNFLKKSSTLVSSKDSSKSFETK